MPCLIEKPCPSLQPSPQLVAFVKRQVRNAQIYTKPDNRSELRHAVVMPVIVQPIDEQYRAICSPLAMVTRDISARGFGLVHEERMSYEWLALRLTFTDEEAVLVGEVRWQKHLGPFYAYGCEVIAKLDDFPDFRDAGAAQW